MRTALISGSYDPIHLGHLNIIRRAAAMYDQVTVAVAVNLLKNSMFTLEERVKMVEDAVKDLPNVKVDKIDGLRADYVNQRHFTADVRSLRNGTDLDYELPMAQAFSDLYQHTETVFLMTDPALSYISSSYVRQVLSLGGDVSKWVAPETLQYINSLHKF